MSSETQTLNSVCGDFAGGMIAEGSECIVVLKNSGEEVMKVDVVSGVPSGDPGTMIKLVSGLSGIPLDDIEIYVYVVCGGARGKDM